MVRDPQCTDLHILLPMHLVEELDLRPRLDSHVMAYKTGEEDGKWVEFHDVYTVKGGERITELLGEWKEGDKDPSELFKGKEP